MVCKLDESEREGVNRFINFQINGFVLLSVDGATEALPAGSAGRRFLRNPFAGRRPDQSEWLERNRIPQKSFFILRRRPRISVT